MGKNGSPIFLHLRTSLDRKWAGVSTKEFIASRGQEDSDEARTSPLHVQIRITLLVSSRFHVLPHEFMNSPMKNQEQQSDSRILSTLNRHRDRDWIKFVSFSCAWTERNWRESGYLPESMCWRCGWFVSRFVADEGLCLYFEEWRMVELWIEIFRWMKRERTMISTLPWVYPLLRYLFVFLSFQILLLSLSSSPSLCVYWDGVVVCWWWGITVVVHRDGEASSWWRLIAFDAKVKVELWYGDGDWSLKKNLEKFCKSFGGREEEESGRGEDWFIEWWRLEVC